MIKVTFKSTPLHIWEYKVPTVFKLVQIILATASNSAYAERTFLLASRLKLYFRLTIGDDMFNTLGLTGWYKRDIDRFWI